MGAAARWVEPGAHVVRAAASSPLAERSEHRAEFGREQLRLFPRREVTALVDPMKINEVVITTLGPSFWRTVDLARKHRHGNGDRDVAVFCSAAYS